MKINVNHIEEIKAALDESAGRARSHTLTNEHFPSQLARDVETELLDAGVMRNHLVGCEIVFATAGPGANSHGRSVIGTYIRLERFPSGWFLVEIRRTKAYPQDGGRRTIIITPSAKHDIISRYVVKEPPVVSDAA